jgi:hypothetical protein
MKKIVCIIMFALVSVNAPAQLAQSSFDSMFMFLDTAYMQNKMLYDKCNHFANMDKYNGGNDTLGSIGTWNQLYVETHNMWMNRANKPNLLAINTSCKNYRTATKCIPLMVMNYNYQQIKPNAIGDGLLTVRNQQVFDSFPRAASPYEQKKVFYIAPALKNLDTTNYTFYIGQGFYFTNDTNTVTAIEIDFADGQGSRQVTWGQNINITYPNTSAAKIIKCRLTIGGNVFISFSKIAPASTCNGNFPAYDGVQIITGQIPYNGEYADSYCWYKLANNNTTGQIQKPAIFVEGIDFGDSYNYAEGRNGGFGWCQFWGADIDPDLGYPELAGMPVFLNTLLAKGYDVVLFDFEDGADYIQKNAFSLVQYIKQLYTNPPLTRQPAVVIGASMGGLVARYALAYMENNNIKHCVREYISFDAPHKGANISLGLQYMIDFFSVSGPNVINASFLDQAERKINRPAAKQLLVNHYTNPNYAGINTPNDAAFLHTSFFNEMVILGYPKKLRKYAIANGSGNSTGQGYNSGAQVFDWNVPSVCPLSPYIRADIFSVGNSNIIFNGRVINNFASVFVCNLGPVLCIPCLSAFSASKTVFNSANSPAYDNCPGGLRNSFKEVAYAINSEFPNAIPNFLTPNVISPNHCFIPSVSAIDVNTTNLFFNIISNINPDNPNPTLTPFEGYRIPSVNQPHVFADPTIGGNAPFGYNTNPQGNLEWGVQQILKSEPNLPAILNASSPNNGVYNFGRPQNALLQSVQISNGGKLFVNANLQTDFSTATNPIPPGGTPVVTANSTFILETCNCNSVQVIIENGGEFILGELNPNNKAIVLFHSGSKLHIKAGGKLIINNNSKLVLESGTNFTYDAGAQIILNGANAMLEIAGTIYLGNNAIFTFSQNQNIQGGFIRLSNPASYSFNIFSQGNASIQLQGQNLNDVLLEVTQESMYTNNIIFLKLTKGKVILGPNASRLNISCPVTLTNLKVTGSGGSSRGVHLYGMNNFASNVNINSCIFENCGTAMSAYLFFYNPSILKLTGCTFRNSNTGLYTVGGGVQLNNVKCNNNASFGWQAAGITYNSTVDFSDFNNNGSDGVFVDGNPVLVNMYRSNAMDNGFTGIYAANVTLNVKCGNIKNNFADGFFIEQNGFLSMSTQTFGGYVDASGNGQYSIELNKANSFDINNGYNDLRLPNGSYGGGCNNHNINCPTTIYGSVIQPTGNNPQMLGEKNRWTPNTNALVPPTNNNTYYNVTNANGFQLNIDGNPQSIQLPCGFFDVVDPCVINPQLCRVSPLVDCPSCNTINTTMFNNQRNDIATRFSISQMDSVIPSGFKNAVGYFKQILRYQYQNLTDNDKYVLNMASRNMHQALSSAFVQQQIYSSNTLPVDSTVNHLIDILNDKINTAPNTTEGYSIKYSAAMEKGKTFRLAGRRDLALQVFEDILTWANNSDITYANQWRCLTNNELLVISGQVQKEKFDSLMTLCPTNNNKITPNINFANSNTSDTFTTPELFYVFPNPTNGTIFIDYNPNSATTETIKFDVFDVTGKLVYTKKYLATINSSVINNMNLREGSYFYKIYLNTDYVQSGKLILTK